MGVSLPDLGFVITHWRVFVFFFGCFVLFFYVGQYDPYFGLVGGVGWEKMRTLPKRSQSTRFLFCFFFFLYWVSCASFIIFEGNFFFFFFVFFVFFLFIFVFFFFFGVFVLCWEALRVSSAAWGSGVLFSATLVGDRTPL